jgi:hypothetical protein
VPEDDEDLIWGIKMLMLKFWIFIKVGDFVVNLVRFCGQFGEFLVQSSGVRLIRFQQGYSRVEGVSIGSIESVKSLKVLEPFVKTLRI